MVLPRWLTGPILWVVAGLTAALGQAPWGLWPLAIAGYALAIVLIARARRPLLAGWVVGTAHFALALNWIVEPFLVDVASTGWLAPIALIAVALGMGLHWILGGIGARLGGPVGVGLGIALGELIRAYIFTGFPWAMPGHALIASPALASASLLGAHGIGLCLLLGLGLILTLRPVVAAFGITVLALPFAIAATLPPAPVPSGDAPVIRLVQPNAPQAQKWNPDFMGIFFRRGLEATAAPSDAPIDLIVWPETALPELLRYSQDVRALIATAANGGPVMIGAQRYGEDGGPRNTAVLLTGEDGAVAHIYDKHRLVPFGEFLPLPRVADALGIGPVASQLAGRYVPGPGPELIDVPGIGPVLPMICYEAIFPQTIGRVARPRAILHLTNDAWFGTGAGPRQHLAIARLRAAESGLPVLRAANTGISAAIDARGRVLSTLGLGETGHIDVALPPALGETIYVRTGDWPVVALVLLGIAGLFLGGRRKPVDAQGVRA